MSEVIRKITAGLAGLLLVGAVSAGLAQPSSSVEDQIRQLQGELKALRKERGELKGARGGQMPMRPAMMGGTMGPMMPQMMQACSQMMAQMGGMGGMVRHDRRFDCGTLTLDDREIVDDRTRHHAPLVREWTNGGRLSGTDP